MPGLFEQFPHTNFHELNLDWMIDLLNQFKQELEDRAVISVNGMTGEVTLYESENVVLPPLTNASSWRLVRMMDGQYVGILFQDDHVWLQQGNSTLKLLTTEDIPTSAGVVSINGMGGIVTLTGADIPIDNSPDPDSIRLALETEHTERVNADNALSNSIDVTNQALSGLLSPTPVTVLEWGSYSDGVHTIINNPTNNTLVRIWIGQSNNYGELRLWGGITDAFKFVTEDGVLSIQQTSATSITISGAGTHSIVRQIKAYPSFVFAP